MFRWVVKDDAGVSPVSSASHERAAMPRNTDGLKIPVISPTDGDSCGQDTTEELRALRQVPQSFALPTMADDHLADYADMEYDTGSRQSKSGYVRAVTNRYRTPYSDVQKGILETAYIQNWGFITIEKKRHLARQLGLTERQIKVWFQNRRARDRRENKRKVQEKRLFGDRSSTKGYDDSCDGDFDDDREMVIDETADGVVDGDLGDTADANGDGELSSDFPSSPEKAHEVTSRPSSASSLNLTPPTLLVQKRTKPAGKSSRKDYEPRKHHHIEGLAEAMNLKHRWEEAMAQDTSSSQPSPLDFTSSGIKIKEEQTDDDELMDYRLGRAFGFDNMTQGQLHYHTELVRQMTLKNFYEHVSNWAKQNDGKVPGAKKKFESNPDWQNMTETDIEMAKAMQLQKMFNNNFHVDILANLTDFQRGVLPNINGNMHAAALPYITGLGARLTMDTEPPKLVTNPPHPTEELPEQKVQPRPTQSRITSPASLTEHTIKSEESTGPGSQVAEMDFDAAAPLDLSVKQRKMCSVDDVRSNGFGEKSDNRTTDSPLPSSPAPSKRKREDDGLNPDRKECKTVSFIWKGKCRTIEQGTVDKF